MEEIILPLRAREESELLTPAADLNTKNAPPNIASKIQVIVISSPRDALSVLKAKPTLNELERCLKYLQEGHEDQSDYNFFHVRLLGPLASQVVFILVNEIVPSYWHVLSTDPDLRGQWRLLVRCLKSVAGIGAILTRLKALCRTDADQVLDVADESRQENLRISLQLLECILHGDKTLDTIWRDVVALEKKELRRPMVMDQLSSFLAGGSILSAAAEASTKLNASSKTSVDTFWSGDGRLYASWLGRNVFHWSKEIGYTADNDSSKSRNRLTSRSLSLGYNDQLLQPIFQTLLNGDPADLRICQSILTGAGPGYQPALANSLLKQLSRKAASTSPDKFIVGSAALVEGLMSDNGRFQQYLIKWLTENSGSDVSFDVKLYRAVVVSLSSNVELLKNAHTASLSRFGSKLHIKQDPILLQEKQAQVFLMLTGALFKKDSAFIRQMKHSSLYLDAISNRLAASSTRAQFLGMVVGMSISDLVDDTDKKLTFSNDEIDGEDGEFYKGLVFIRDSIGEISDLQPSVSEDEAGPSKASFKTANQKAKPKAEKMVDIKPKIVAIEEISDSDESEDDLPVYAKPDSDAEDEDDDPTLINRNKPTAPVYIRDMIAGLRDNENYDRHRLAIETAPKLIRRKSKFGTEVTEHLEELATQVIGLKDDEIDVENYQQLRLQAMVAIVVAKPEQMGPWFANTFFNGDYSISQRLSILTALALSARELAGLKDEDSDMTGANDAPSFPTKRLPAKYEPVYLSPSALPVTRLSGRLERNILQPLALSAADAATGPNALKVRTFSSRLDPAKQAARTRTIPNRLARLVADAFFFPLTSRWRSVLQSSTRGGGGSGGSSSSSSSPSSVIGDTPILLSHLVRTLALILSAAGPGTLSLPTTTAEFWALLLGLRRSITTTTSTSGGGGGGGGGGDPVVVEALLLGFLTLLELNDGDRHHRRRAADVLRDHADDLQETRTWVAAVLDNVPAGGSGGGKEGERIRVLAAGVMVKADDLVDRYRKELMGPAAEML